MSTKQDLLDLINKNYTAGNSLNSEDFVEEARTNNAANLQAALDVINTGYDSQISNTQKFYDKEIADTKTAYENEYLKNSVQNEINKMKIEQSMATIGLTDSGLNRTQQTAAQLSYANQKGDIDLARQGALDDLSLKLTDAITTLQNNKASDIRETENYWNDLSYNQGIAAYNDKLNYYNDQIKTYTEELADIIESENDAAAEVQKKAIEAEAALQKALISASGKTGNVQDDTTQQKIYWFRGVSNENDNYLYYNTETGKTEEIPPYTNPYNSQDNRIAYSAEYNDKNIGFFQLASGKTGYQPRGLVSEGGKFSAATCDGMIVKYDLYGNGKENTIWKSKTNKYFIWDDINNRYLDLTEEIKALFPNIQ